MHQSKYWLNTHLGKCHQVGSISFLLHSYPHKTGTQGVQSSLLGSDQAPVQHHEPWSYVGAAGVWGEHCLCSASAPCWNYPSAWSSASRLTSLVGLHELCLITLDNVEEKMLTIKQLWLEYKITHYVLGLTLCSFLGCMELVSVSPAVSVWEAGDTL